MAKAVLEIRSLARAHTEACIHTLASIMRKKDAPAAARVVAANSLLERGWGKAPTTIGGIDGGDIRVVIRQIVETAIESDTKVIEHQVPEEDDSE